MTNLRILIVNPPFYRLQGASLVHYPPGCCYVAAGLEKAGFESLIFNADYDPSKKTILGNTNHINLRSLPEQHLDYESRLHSENDPIWLEISDRLDRFKPDVLIVSVFSTTLTAGNRVAQIAKQLNSETKTIFEGCFNRGLHCAVNPAENGDFSVMDFAVRGEPDLTVAEIIQTLAAGNDQFSHILGLTWKSPDGTIVHNPDRPYIEDLDQVPFPARHRLENYEQIPPHCFQSIYGSRGCPFHCVFCGCHTSMGFKPRTRSAENMVSEIEEVHRRFGTRYFYLCDDIFFINKKRAREFCRLLIEKRLPVYFSAQTRAEMVDDETLALVKRAGGQHIAVGVEVGNPDVRKLIKKGNTVKDVRRCAELIKRNGLRMVAFCMLGLPWEGRKEIQQTVDLVKEIKPYIVYSYLPTPAAGTELANLLLQKNPEGLKEFTDRCHIDLSASLSDRMEPADKEEVLGWALDEFVKLNRKSLLLDVAGRPAFYWALANDMGFLRHPSHLYGYLKDYLASS